MDLKYDKGRKLNLNHNKGQHWDKKSLLLQNGIVNLGFITNGFCSKQNPCNDGVSSDSGNTSLKKSKARQNSIKNTQCMYREEIHAMFQSNQTQEPEAFGSHLTEKQSNFRFDCFQDSPKVDPYIAVNCAGSSQVSVVEHLSNYSDSKTVGLSVKKPLDQVKAKPLIAKEDSWTLCKPPPVFPVDHSSAKIVPKISYASKVKGNLNKASAQAAAETLTPQMRVRLNQVPMSAMKTITAPHVTNGPVPGEETNPSVGTSFAPGSSNNLPASSIPCGENVASFSDSSCISRNNSTEAALEPRNCSFLIYPLNMQPMLQSSCQVNVPAAETNQNILGDIFQNQWGLSFINEPSLGPEKSGELTVGRGSAAIKLKGGHPVLFAQPYIDLCPFVLEPLLIPLAQDSEKIMCASIAALNCCAPDTAICEKDSHVHAPSQESMIMSNPSQGNVEPTLASSTYQLNSLSKDKVPFEELKRGWGTFDLKAAVTYHTTEMGHLFDLQKQDQKSIVFYGEHQMDRSS